jgi:hypothetical protein
MDSELSSQLALRKAAREELKRKLEQEEEEDMIVKRMHADESKQKEELDSKEAEMKASSEAGNWVLPFGKYANQRIAEVDAHYLSWIMGFKLQKCAFVETTFCEALPYIRDNHRPSVEKVKQFLTWRCWVCHEQNTTFKRAKLCVSCWKRLNGR